MAKKQKAVRQLVLPAVAPSLLKHHNQRLFSDYFLDSVMASGTWKGKAEWQNLLLEAAPVMAVLQARYEQFSISASAANEAQTESDWIRPVLEALGHTFEVQAKLKMPGPTSAQHPDYVFYASEEQRLASRGRELDDRAAQYGALAVGDAKQWDVPLDQMRKGASDSFSNKNPSFQIFFYMLHSKLPWGILTNGRKWRLYHETTAYKLDVYYEIDLPDLLASDEIEQFLYFYAFFRRAAFTPDHPLSLDILLAASTASAQKIREDLRDQVYDALTYVAQGFFACSPNQLTPTPETCQRVYEHSLILLYRLLFILYAESRELLPVDNNSYQRRYSLRAIKDQVRLMQKDQVVLLPHAGIIWSQLRTLFRSIDLGEKLLSVSTFDGGLFDADRHLFLENYIVGDLDLARAIDKLARRPRDEQDFSEDSFIDYRDLSERHLGTIYEGLLEYTLHVANEPMAELRSTSAIVPQRQASEREIVRIYQPGEVYLVTDTGQRKTTGSYYTPDYIVKYMVEQTLKPVLDQAMQHAASDEQRIQAVLAINVLDPAMGSGHFPVEVVEYIARYLVELGVQPEKKDPQEADMIYWKRRAAQHCIYGVDANPLAVDLAKLSLWLATAARGYPLNFLDHHLRPGNALIGAWLNEVATSEHPRTILARRQTTSQPGQGVAGTPEDAEVVQFSMLEDREFNQSLSSALDIMISIARMPGNTIQEVKQQEAAYTELRARFVHKYQDIMNLGVALFYDISIEDRLWAAYAAYAVQQQGIAGAEKGYAPTLEQARQMGQARRFFHWELEFPDIFFEEDGRPKGAHAGFDAVIGNPPYVRQEKLTADKPFYQEHYAIYHGSADLFIYFFDQGLRLLRPDGRLAYISSNSWLRANYAAPLRRFLRTQTSVEQIIDLGNTRVFADAPDLSPAIQVVRKLPPDSAHMARVAIFARGDVISEFRENLAARLFEVSIHDQPDEGWQLRTDASRLLLTRLMAQGRPLGEIVGGGIYYGIKTGLNEAFIVDNATRKRLIRADPASAQLIKSLVRGEDLRPWYQEDEGRWLICLPSGWTAATFPGLQARDEDLAWEKFATAYPVLAEHLKPFAASARKRQDKGQYWWELRPCDYYSAFDQPKIFWADIAKYPRFSWDEQGVFTNNKGYILPAKDISLLGILQSRVIWFCITRLCAPLGERVGLTVYQHFTQYIERLPIPALADEQRAQIGGLAQQLTEVARVRYRVRREMAQRIKSDLGEGQGKMTDRLDEWWRLEWPNFREEVRKAFKREIPVKERGEWQEFFQEQQEEIKQLTVKIVGLEEALNAAVYAVYELDEEERALVERETKYQYGEW
ncbi:MAG TPA: N-6 DNA methylase [Ktedonobacteraceae bacterium]|nr:N-6 DNA methylase [Ktedonobacteraceae bacterium]